MTNWANLVTFIRLLLIPVVVALYYSSAPHAEVIAAVLFTIASVSDWLDGYLARRFEMSSEFGAFLDPVADKLLVTAVLVMLVSVYPALLLPTLIIISREILISALREWMAARGQRGAVAVAFIGKLKTTFQMLALIGLILVTPTSPGWLFAGSFGLLLIAALLSLWSMLVYFSKAWKVLTATNSD